jgi:hypothetical protein
VVEVTDAPVIKATGAAGCQPESAAPSAIHERRANPLRSKEMGYPDCAGGQSAQKSPDFLYSDLHRSRGDRLCDQEIQRLHGHARQHETDRESRKESPFREEEECHDD